MKEILDAPMDEEEIDLTVWDVILDPEESVKTRLTYLTFTIMIGIGFSGFVIGGIVLLLVYFRP